ncbi:MAG: DUF3307 domain-containing protein [Rhodobacteraceae bacterium]|nr:DUF3307 domain-containing protein [Paracoccaceae bacterium]
MQSEPGMIIAALVLFALKHFVADFVLQTGWMVQGKGRYGHPGGLVHAAIHVVGSVPALVVLAVAPSLFLLLLLGEGIVHYHIDYLKEGITRRLGVGPADKAFWVLLGGDQFLHHATYLAMVAIVLRGGG